jgi:DNA gyrase subunit A
MELGTIRQINIDVEMQASYLDYAMSVIVARALPDVRDGLKPVHRRILYAMHDLGLDPGKPYKKSARIVGEVLGKYHPHGDAAVYEAMVRMAQSFSLRYPLVDGQGNFGSIDGDSAAAMRYTEARLAAISDQMLGDIARDTVDWTDNFDGTLREPVVLPAALPNLLVNGASGIAVGMATNIPPHNLAEVCDALCYLIDNYDRRDDVTVEDLMRFIPGPDFPTGGVIYRYVQEGSGAAAEQTDVIARAYAGGKGSIVLQAKAHIEDMSRNRSRIVVTELPYMANKTNLLERIADLVRDGRLEGITDLRDESDRTGMRICIEMTRTVEPRQTLAELFRLTPLQTTFGVSLLALVDGEPRLLSLKWLLQYYVAHRQEVIERRARHDLERARQRAHVLEGLLRALDVLDEVIALIRKSRTADTARQNLIGQFKFTEVQAQAILDMQLRRLAALERRKLQDEYRETLALIKELEELLASPAKVLALIRRNLMELRSQYADARRTQIADRVKGALTTLDVLPDQDIWITLTADGVLARQRRDLAAGFSLPAPSARLLHVLAAHTRHDVYLFSANGQATRLHAHQIPEDAGGHYADLSGLGRRDRIVALLSLPREEQPVAGRFLLLATAQGKVKRVAAADFTDAIGSDPVVIALDRGDELIWAGVSQGDGEFMLATASGQAIRFSEEDVRPMGLPAGGIGGIKLAEDDRVVAALAISVATADQELALATSAGYGKRVALADFPRQGRNGQGVVAARLPDKTTRLVGAAVVGPDDALAFLFAKTASRLLPATELPEMGRPAQGKPLAGLMVGEPVREMRAVEGPRDDGRALAAGPPQTTPKGKARRVAAAKGQGATKPKKGKAAPAGVAAKPVEPTRRKPRAEKETEVKTPSQGVEPAAPPARATRRKRSPVEQPEPPASQPAAAKSRAAEGAVEAAPAVPARRRRSPVEQPEPPVSQPTAGESRAAEGAAEAAPARRKRFPAGQPEPPASRRPPGRAQQKGLSRRRRLSQPGAGRGRLS